MSNASMPAGSIVWQDLTVPDASDLRTFYRDVAGWTFHEQNMGEYEDYNAHAGADGPCVAGLCHQRGANASIPPVWLMYIHVDDVRASASQIERHGGSIIEGPRPMGGHLFCIFRDPAGAIAAIIGPDESS